MQVITDGSVQLCKTQWHYYLSKWQDRSGYQQKEGQNRVTGVKRVWWFCIRQKIARQPKVDLLYLFTSKNLGMDDQKAEDSQHNKKVSCQM